MAINKANIGFEYYNLVMGLLQKIWLWFRKELLNSTKEEYLQKWISKNQKTEVYLQDRALKSAIATFCLKNEVDGTGMVILALDSIPELIRQLNARKLTEGVNFRYRQFERDLENSSQTGRTHRISVVHVYPQEGQKQWNRRLYQIIDTNWEGNSYNKDSDVCKYLALQFLEQNLPSHRSNWSEWVCDRNAFDWEALTTRVAKKVYGNDYNPKTIVRYSSQPLRK